MAYDEDLATRVRAVLATRDDVAEQRMFGGLAFLLGRRMAVAASGSGGLMVRTDPAGADRLLDRPGVEQVVMRGRPAEGWLRVLPVVLEDDEELARWVALGVAHVEGDTAPPV